LREKTPEVKVRDIYDLRIRLNRQLRVNHISRPLQNRPGENVVSGLWPEMQDFKANESRHSLDTTRFAEVSYHQSYILLSDFARRRRYTFKSMTSDLDLLGQFAREKSQDAFTAPNGFHD
jgi:hypothetical protein